MRRTQVFLNAFLKKSMVEKPRMKTALMAGSASERKQQEGVDAADAFEVELVAYGGSALAARPKSAKNSLRKEGEKMSFNKIINEDVCFAYPTAANEERNGVAGCKGNVEHVF